MPSVTCNTCGHAAPDDQTFCERCGAGLHGERAAGCNTVPAVLGFLIGAVFFLFIGAFINAIAMSSGMHTAGAVDFGIVLVLGAAVAVLIRTRRIGSGFYLGLLVALLGGFAICGGMFASTRS